MGPEEVQRRITNRELQVGSLIGQGRTNGEIGALLGISEHTVKRHVSSIMNKLMVSRRSQIAVIAVTQGWGNNQTGDNKDTNEGK